jgi:hypothetical protein
MKKRDIVVIVTVAAVAGIFSFVISNLLFGGGKAYNLTAPQIAPISTEFITPDSQYFNDNAIDPTVDIQIGDTTNPDVLQN